MCREITIIRKYSDDNLIHFTWYCLPDVLRTKYYQAIILISKELRIAKEYLGNSLLDMAVAPPLNQLTC